MQRRFDPRAESANHPEPVPGDSASMVNPPPPVAYTQIDFATPTHGAVAAPGLSVPELSRPQASRCLYSGQTPAPSERRRQVDVLPPSTNMQYPESLGHGAAVEAEFMVVTPGTGRVVHVLVMGSYDSPLGLLRPESCKDIDPSHASGTDRPPRGHLSPR